MFNSFDGQTRSRPAINLGGGGGAATGKGGSSASSSSRSTPGEGGGPFNDSIAQRARYERQQREHLRRLDRTARTIQSFYRSRRIAGTVRDGIRGEYDALIGSLEGAVSSSSATAAASPSSSTTALQTPSTTPTDAQAYSTLLQLSLQLAFILRDGGNRADLARAGRWARLVATGKPGGILLFAAFPEFAMRYRQDPSDQCLGRWRFAVRKIARAILCLAGRNASNPSMTLFLELVRQLLDPAKYRAMLLPELHWFPADLASSLATTGGLADLRQHIMSWAPNTKPISPSLSPAMASAAAIVWLCKGSPSEQACLRSFITQILTIPDLLTPSRLPRPALNRFLSLPPSSAPPFPALDILQAVSEMGHGETSELEPASWTHLLANAVNLVRPRLMPNTAGTNAPSAGSGITSGKELVQVLGALQVVLHNTPASMLSNEPKGKSRATAIEIDAASVDRDTIMEDISQSSKSASKPSSSSGQSTPTPALSATTSSSIYTLISESFLSPLIALSTRYSASSRPALSSFLVSLLYAFPASKKEDIVNTLVYSGLSSSTSQTGGLLRELWRGYLRSSTLAKALNGGHVKSTSVITSLLSSEKCTGDWNHFVLVAELYSRALLTLGDDEFFSSSNTAGTIVSRNPLTIDEVIGLSALLRNIVFTLYWQPEVLRNGQTDTENRLAGTSVTYEQFRKLGTGLLQMIHARDSRRQFTPANHWIMTSQIDIQSFIESAIMEDQAIDSEEAVVQAQDRQFGRRGGRYDDEDTDDDADELPRPQTTVKRNLPSRRQMAFLSPRLGVLNNIPFVIPFEVRVSIFQQFIYNDRVKLGLASGTRRSAFDSRRVGAAATIRRNHVADDGFSALNSLGPALKERLAIRFIDQYGQEEAGIDGGGLFKEFLTSLSKEAFDIDRGLWLETPSHELYPAATSYSRDSFSLQWYAFLGRIMGKALYEGILVDVPFAPFFLSKWLGRPSGFDDLASFDPDLYHGLVQLKNYAGNVEKDLSLTFSVTDDDFGVTKTIELIPNGSNIAVTNENRISYIYRVSDYRLNKQVEKQCAAFFSGLSDLVDPKWLRMFNQVELGLLVGGAETNIDIDDLRHNTVYTRGFDESHPSIQYFWTVVQGFSQKDKKALIKFITSCPRPPLLGFGQLNPKFAIGNGGDDQERLPSASTCVNLLKLPTYSSPELLRQKLLASIHSGAGFDLS